LDGRAENVAHGVDVWIAVDRRSSRLLAVICGRLLQTSGRIATSATAVISSLIASPK
jgi:hypothetical protein